jgi:hypothetical protein
MNFKLVLYLKETRVSKKTRVMMEFRIFKLEFPYFSIHLLLLFTIKKYVKTNPIVANAKIFRIN